jgi:lysozyme
MAKNKSKLFWWILIIALVLVTPTIYLINILRQKQKAKIAKTIRYTAFGIDMPTGYAIHGIDVSSYQEVIDWPSVRQMEINKIKIGFAFMKATEGLDDKDKYFKRNWLAAQKDSVTRGAYLFFLATKSGKKQANNFIKTVQLSKGDLPPVLDVEQLYGVKPAIMRARVKECLKALEDAYKVKPIIYSYANFYEQYLGKEFDGYPLWIAHYFEKEKPRVQRDWLFWQHSEGGKVNGIAGNVDFNVFKGDTAAFKNLLLK